MSLLPTLGYAADSRSQEDVLRETLFDYSSCTRLIGEKAKPVISDGSCWNTKRVKDLGVGLESVHYPGWNGFNPGLESGSARARLRQVMFEEVLNPENYLALRGKKSRFKFPKRVIIRESKEPKFISLTDMYEVKEVLLLPDCSAQETDAAVRVCTKQKLAEAIRIYSKASDFEKDCGSKAKNKSKECLVSIRKSYSEVL